MFTCKKEPEQYFISSGAVTESITIKTPAGVRMCDMLVTVERDQRGDVLFKVVVIEDETENVHKDSLLQAINQAAAFLLNSDVESFEDDLYKAMRCTGLAVEVDRVYIWKNQTVGGKLFCSQVYEWSEGAEPQQGNEYTQNIPYSESIPGWEETLSVGSCVNGLVRDMADGAKAQLSPQGILSILVVPVIMRDHFWGFVGFDDCHNERVFTEREEAILRSGSLLFAHAFHRNEMVKSIRETSSQLELALEQVKAASKAKSDFLSNMSHEMRTPMNAIIGMTTIAMKAEDPAEKDHALNKIGDASTHLLGVINDVLDMAKIEANKLELVPVEYNFDRMLQKVISVVNFRVDEKKQDLSVSVDNNLPRFVIGDDQRLAQVITNLMSNAVKFTPDGGHIHLNASLIGESDGVCELRIEVTDNGIGISEQQQRRLFHAFEQADSSTSREYGGTGLGLVISKRIVDLMGGDIWVESELGSGAKFIFTAKVLRGKKNTRSLLDNGVNWSNVRILVVDDMPEILDQFRVVFENLDISCDLASDGAEACRLVEERGLYDIYFIDLVMPGMDGIELTSWIKARTQRKQSVIIMITAADWGQYRDKALSSGIDMHLLKPLFTSMIIDCMNEIFGINDIELCHSARDGEFEGKRMLVAEDMEINREIIIAILENTGLVIDCAENGKEALSMLAGSSVKYDIVFMDMQMPQMDGLEATRHIRALPGMQKEHLPIIAMTANVFKDDIDACLEAGMDDHIGKPLDVEIVLEKLRKFI